PCASTCHSAPAQQHQLSSCEIPSCLGSLLYGTEKSCRASRNSGANGAGNRFSDSPLPSLMPRTKGGVMPRLPQPPIPRQLTPTCTRAVPGILVGLRRLRPPPQPLLALQGQNALPRRTLKTDCAFWADNCDYHGRPWTPRSRGRSDPKKADLLRGRV